MDEDFREWCGIPDDDFESVCDAAAEMSIRAAEWFELHVGHFSSAEGVSEHMNAVSQLASVILVCWLTEDLAESWGWDHEEREIQEFAVDIVQKELLQLLRSRREFVRQWRKEIDDRNLGGSPQDL